MSLLALGGVALTTRRLVRREKPAYPAPESLIIELDTELLPHEDSRHDRTILLEGAANLRDIGGYRTTSGRYVRWGRVYRSGTLAALTDSDLNTLAALGIKLVCDLRSDDEVSTAPDRRLPDADYARIPINADRDGDSRQRLRALLFDKSRFNTMLLEIYRRIIDEHAAVFGDVIRRLADENNLPALIHCTAGKDRAGLAAAILLLALGVPEETVIADYTLSNRYYDHFYRYAQQAVQRLAILGISAADMHPMLTADPKTLKAALDYLITKYGSVRAYLRDRAGVDDAIFDQVKANLLT